MKTSLDQCTSIDQVVDFVNAAKDSNEAAYQYALDAIVDAGYEVDCDGMAYHLEVLSDAGAEFDSDWRKIIDFLAHNGYYPA